MGFRKTPNGVRFWPGRESQKKQRALCAVVPAVHFRLAVQGKGKGLPCTPVILPHVGPQRQRGCAEQPRIDVCADGDCLLPLAPFGRSWPVLRACALAGRKNTCFLSFARDWLDAHTRRIPPNDYYTKLTPRRGAVPLQQTRPAHRLDRAGRCLALAGKMAWRVQDGPPPLCRGCGRWCR